MKTVVLFWLVSLMMATGCSQTTQSLRKESMETLPPQEIFVNKCASCHGGNLQGGLGPNLQKVGKRLNKEQISAILKDGRGRMPSQSHLSDEVREKLATWLSEKK